jgi:anti-sigma-K factor RskA
MAHGIAADLMASYALDAVEAEERAELEEHLAGCPRCRADLDGLRVVVTALGNSVEQLPEGLWSSITSRLSERRPEAALPMPPLLYDELGGEPATPLRGDRSWVSRSKRTALASVMGAAAAAAIILAVSLVRADDEVSRLQTMPSSTSNAVVSALETRGHRIITMENSGELKLAQFVLADGRGYLVSSTLPTLPSSETYQLWGVIGGQSISLGLMGRTPSQSIFTLAGTSVASRLNITVEPLSGAVVPSGPVVATGTI